MKTRLFLNYGLYISIGVMIMITGSANAYKINGQLRVHPTNPRYFTDDSGNVIYLTGSHMWNNLVDMGRNDPPEAFDFASYLDFLQRYNHNFIRLWTWDSTMCLVPEWGQSWHTPPNHSSCTSLPPLPAFSCSLPPL